MEGKSGPAARFRHTLTAIAVASCFAAPPALANPTGPTVVHGAAAIHQAGNLLQITNSPNAIINWQSFSIGANEITRFIQQSQSSAVLNRVVGAGGAIDPSVILGTLQSNGRVFLINPSGILFGAGAQTDVAGLVATSLNLSNADFLAGRLRFTDVPGAGSVINQGNITSGADGNVYLVGPAVMNSGIITSPQGEVILAAGYNVELVNPGTPNLRVEIAASNNEARNLGQIIAESGRIGIYAGLINHSGTIRADSAVATEDGRIVLRATRNTTLEAGSVTTANGPTGGSIQIQSDDTTLIAGSIEARGLGSPLSGGGAAPTGDGVAAKGGRVEILGNLVGVIGNARINASGESGGGTVLVGGDFRGEPALSAVEGNPIQNAFRTYVGPDTTIKADAITSGDGGKVIVWSDDATRAYGSISARGGVQSGNGGFVEVSSKNSLDFASSVDATAPHGRVGTLLLDPLNIIVAVGGAATLASVAPFTVNPGTTQTIDPATLNAAGATVVLQATDDVTVQNPVNLTTAGAGFVAQAGRDVNINATVTTRGGNIILEADSPHQPGGSDGVGVVRINSAVSTLGGGATGGSITLIGGAGTPANNFSDGGSVLNADVTAGTGGLNLSLTQAGTINFGIGAVGNTQLSSKDTDHLMTTGPLVIGQATTGGDNGLGLNAQTLTVNSITNNTATPIELSPASGGSFTLVAGAGGILLDRPLFTFQPTTITSIGGTVTVNDTIGTNNNPLTIAGTNVVINGSINTGTGSLTCGGCPVPSTVVWDGNTDLDGGDGVNWFDLLNWNTNSVPTNMQDVTIGAGFGTIQVNGVAVAKSLVAGSPVQLPGGSSLTLSNASQFSDTFTLSGGSLAGTGSVTIGGSGGSLTWSGGTIGNGGGMFFLSSDRSANLSNALTLNRLFENHGTLTLSSATLGGTGSITNVGTMSVSGSTLSVPITNSSPVQFTGGTNIFASGSGITNGTVDFLGGTTTFQSGSTYNVATTNISGGTANFDNTASTTTLNLSSGTLGGSGNFTVNAAFDWSGSTVTGSGAFTTNGTSTLSGSADKDLVDRTWTNAGTVNLTGGRLDLQGTSGAFTNQATGIFNASTSSGSLVSGNAGNVFNNQGTFNKDSSGTGAIDGSMTFNNAGTVNVNAGTLRLDVGGTETGTYAVGGGTTLQFNGGTHTLAAGSNVTGGGLVNFSGANVTVAGSYGIAATGTTWVTGGEVDFNVPLAFANTVKLASGGSQVVLDGTGNLVFNGAFDWSGPAGIAGTGTLTTNGVTTVTGAGPGINKNWTNNGTVNVNGGGELLYFLWASNPAAVTWTNAPGGTINLNGSNTAPIRTFNGTAHALLNQGTINKQPGSGATQAIGSASLGIVNQAGGSINVNSGTLQLSNFPANAGTINIANGATLSTGEASLTNSATGIIQGSGTLELDGATLTNNGTVSPGASPGILTINGDYTQGPAGVLALEIGGTSAGSQYDRLVVTGKATLGGTLTVTLINGFAPAGGETFAVIQSNGTVSGTFDSTNLPASPSLSANYLASGVSLISGITNAVESSTQAVVAATEQSNAAVAAASSQSDTQGEDEKRQREKKPICSGGSSGGGGGGGIVLTGGGSGGARCTARGCF